MSLFFSLLLICLRNMRLNAVSVAVCLLQISPATNAKPLGTVGATQSNLQVPLEDLNPTHHQHASSKRLHGRFLHITGGVKSLVCHLMVLYDAHLLQIYIKIPIIRSFPLPTKMMLAIEEKEPRARMARKLRTATLLSPS